MSRIKDGLLSYVMLFGSMSTLICCALPTLLVSVGLGAVMAGLASNIPALIWISENKKIVFIGAGTLLFLNGVLLLRNRNAPCPVDPKLRDACIKGRKNSRIIYLISLGVYLLGFFFAYIAPII